MPAADAVAGRVTRIPAGHPEGYLEGFANLYSDAAELISAKLEGREPDPAATLVPTVRDGVAGVKFIEAVVESSRKNGAWVGAEHLDARPRDPSSVGGLGGGRAGGGAVLDHHLDASVLLPAGRRGVARHRRSGP